MRYAFTYGADAVYAGLRRYNQAVTDPVRLSGLCDQHHYVAKGMLSS